MVSTVITAFPHRKHHVLRTLLRNKSQLPQKTTTLSMPLMVFPFTPSQSYCISFPKKENRNHRGAPNLNGIQKSTPNHPSGKFFPSCRDQSPPCHRRQWFESNRSKAPVFSLKGFQFWKHLARTRSRQPFDFYQKTKIALQAGYFMYRSHNNWQRLFETTCILGDLVCTVSTGSEK